MANLIVACYFAKRGFENIARIIKRYVDRSPRRSDVAMTLTQVRREP